MTGLAVRVLVWAAGLAGVSLSPFWAGAVVMLLGTAAVGGGLTWFGVHQYNAGADDREAEWQARALQSKLDAANADLASARRSAADAAFRVETITATSGARNKELEDYVQWLETHRAAPPADSDKQRRMDPCGWTQPELDRMRRTRKPHAAQSPAAGKAGRPVQSGPTPRFTIWAKPKG